MRSIKRIASWLLGVAVVVTVATFAFLAITWSGADTSTVGDERFEPALRIPPLLEGAPDGQGRRVFELEAQVGETEILPGKPTETWGYNGTHLGPTLRARQGEDVTIRVRNDLPESTTTHWHGMHLPAAADGGPHQPIAQGATWEPEWTIDQPAATLWYHPHPHERTEEQVYRGLAGMFILDDEASASLDLPGEYGVDDLPLILQDVKLDDDGALDFSRGIISPVGRLGDRVLVNGTVAPHAAIERERVRLRVLNASTARIYELGFDDDREFALVGTDGGLVDAPRTLRRVLLSPGERAELVVSFRPGESVVLRSYPPDLGVDFFNHRFAGGDDRFDLIRFDAADDLDASPALPAQLVELPAVRASDADRERRFELSSNSINGRKMQMDTIDWAAELDTTELWEVHNRGGTPHNFHVHDLQFRVLDVGGQPPPARLQGFKDTVYVPPGETIRLLAEFTDYADPDLPYMFHCHLLEHEDRGMMGQFVVVEPGQSAGSVPDHAHHDHGADG